MKQIKLLISMLIIAVVAVACGGDKNSPEGVTKQFVEMFASGDTSNMANIIDMTPNPNDAEDAMAKAMVSEKMGMLATEGKKHYDEQGGLKDIQMLFIIQYKNNTSEEVADMTTIKTKDGWRVKF